MYAHRRPTEPLSQESRRLEPSPFQGFEVPPHTCWIYPCRPVGRVRLLLSLYLYKSQCTGVGRVQAKVGRELLVQAASEAQKFLVSMTLVALADDLALQQFDSGK